jgi:hypothetical protein
MYRYYHELTRAWESPGCARLHRAMCGSAGVEYLKPVPNNYLQRWPVSRRVNSSKADADDPSLIERVELAAA